MPRKILVAFAAFVWLLVWVEHARAATLTIEIPNVHVAQGKVMLQIMADEAQFRGQSGPVASFMQHAQAGTMVFAATLPAGTYAIRVMHDLNDNDELDANFIGMPSEPWGFSNNATGSFGPPGWEDVRFDLNGDATQSIELRK